jgi:hypothetical protein
MPTPHALTHTQQVQKLLAAGCNPAAFCENSCPIHMCDDPYYSITADGHGTANYLLLKNELVCCDGWRYRSDCEALQTFFETDGSCLPVVGPNCRRERKQSSANAEAPPPPCPRSFRPQPVICCDGK